MLLAFGRTASPLAAQQTNLPPLTEGYPFAKGTLERLNLDARQFTLRTPVGARRFEVTARTYIFRGKDKITLDKLRIGETLKLSYYTNDLGQVLVKRIKVDQSQVTTNPVLPLEASK